jgi:hypothetical protein
MKACCGHRRRNIVKSYGNDQLTCRRTKRFLRAKRGKNSSLRVQ